MELTFYIASIIAIFSTLMVITRLNGVHALLYLVVSLLSVAVVFYTLGAPFIAALEVIIYAGAIMVLFIFVVMMLNLGKEAVAEEAKLLKPGMWVIPGILVLVLLVEFIFMLKSGGAHFLQNTVVSAEKVGFALFGPYLLGAELSAMLLLAGIVGAYHLGRRKKSVYHRFIKQESEK